MPVWNATFSRDINILLNARFAGIGFALLTAPSTMDPHADVLLQYGFHQVTVSDITCANVSVEKLADRNSIPQWVELPIICTLRALHSTMQRCWWQPPCYVFIRHFHVFNPPAACFRKDQSLCWKAITRREKLFWWYRIVWHYHNAKTWKTKSYVSLPFGFVHGSTNYDDSSKQMTAHVNWKRLQEFQRLNKRTMCADFAGCQRRAVTRSSIRLLATDVCPQFE